MKISLVSRTVEAKATNRACEHVVPIKQKSLSFQIGFSKTRGFSRTGEANLPAGRQGRRTEALAEHVVPIKKKPRFVRNGVFKER